MQEFSIIHETLTFCKYFSKKNIVGGGKRDRTDDLLLAKQALSQLSYAPTIRFNELISVCTVQAFPLDDSL